MKALTSFDGVRRSELVAVVRGVGKSFDECLTWSLKEVTFGVRRGEVFGLAGPSGSGKTALLKLLAGHLRPTEGKVKVFGSSPRRGAKKSRIGYLPQTSGPNNHANSGGVLDWVGGLFRRTETRQNPAAAESRDKTRWRGELAQTIYGKRDLVILDEPFSNLEPSERGELKNLIETLAQQGKTVILSSSSLEDVLGVCQRIAVLNGGRMEILGTLDELQASPEAVRALAPILPEPVAQKLQGIVR
ncbi:MAG TPA: ATP-binding cassette domain-containing protein, partial [Verrucomicrobiae bacterium]|nr:ATP-binding cassette domain-containing protein [Verrucomicrobiae bacterium]